MTVKKTLLTVFGRKAKAKPAKAEPVPAAESGPAVPSVAEPEPVVLKAATRPGTCRIYRVSVGAST